MITLLNSSIYIKDETAKLIINLSSVRFALAYFSVVQISHLRWKVSNRITVILSSVTYFGVNTIIKKL